MGPFGRWPGLLARPDTNHRLALGSSEVSELGLKDRPWSAAENRRVVMEAVEIFGVGRCMWASNFPVAGLRVGYRDQLTAMLAMFDGFSAADRRALFHDNAARFYRLDAG